LLGLEYGSFGRLFPILALHATLLLPLNILRLRDERATLRTPSLSESSHPVWKQPNGDITQPPRPF
jgi:hypothetical protein